MRQSCVVILAMLFFVPGLRAQGVGNQPAAVQPSSETIVYPVRSGPANDLADALMHVFPDHQIAAQLEHNLLLIRVDANTKDEMLGVLKQLDRPKRTVEVHAYLLRSHGTPLSADETAGLSGPRNEVLQRIAAMQKDDQISIDNRIELTTIENQQARVQIGKQLPVVVGTTVSASRGRSNSYQRISTGTLFSVTARTTPDNEIVMEISFEKSEVDPVASSDDDAGPPAGVSTLTHQTSVQLAEGEAALAGTMVGKPTAGSGHSYLVVTANVRHGVARQVAGSSGAVRRSDPASRVPRSTGASRTGSTSSGRFDRGGGLTSERFDRMVRDVFDRADRDGNGILSGDELDGRSVGPFRASFGDAKEITYGAYRRAMASRLGVTLPEQTEAKPKSEPKSEPAETRKSAVDPRYLAYARKMVEKYDANGDGKLNAEESGQMSKNPAPADVDDDGLVTPEELATWYQKR